MQKLLLSIVGGGGVKREIAKCGLKYVIFSFRPIVSTETGARLRLQQHPQIEPIAQSGHVGLKIP